MGNPKRRRDLYLGAALLGLLLALGVGQAMLERTAVAQSQPGVQAPMFQVDPLWPKPLPNGWIIGSAIGVSVDAQDHIWIIHRGGPTMNAKEIYATANPRALAVGCFATIEAEICSAP